jgi:serine/threonine protein kinase
MSSQIIVTPEKNNTFIGNGSYGNVYKNNNDVKKIMNCCQEDNELEFHEVNMNEVMFLSSYRNISFIPKYKSAKLNITKNANKVELNTIELDMEYCGINLEKYSVSLPYNDRLKLIPSLMTQLSRMLVWMKMQNIVHVDIKPANICIENNIIKLIDWGFVTRLNKKYNKSIYGTKIFCDPYTIKNKILTREYDMFSCGITLCFFITKSYADNNWFNIISNFSSDVNENNKKTVEYFLGDNIKQHLSNVIPNGEFYYNLICEMINVDPEYRITPEKLYEKLPQNLKDEFPLNEYINKEITELSELPVSEQIIGKAIYYMLSIKEYETMYSSIDHAIKLLYRYLNKDKIINPGKIYDIENIKLISSCCLMLSAFSNTRDMYEISIVKILNNYVEDFNYNDLVYTMNDILTLLDFDCYPESKITEGLSEQVEMNKWFNVYLTYDDNGNIIPNVANIFNAQLKLSVMNELGLLGLFKNKNHNVQRMKETVARLLSINIKQLQNKSDFDTSMKTMLNLFNFILKHKSYFINYEKLMSVIHTKMNEMSFMITNNNYTFTRNKYSKSNLYYYNKLKTIKNLLF